MPILTNQRWERFAQELAKGKTADEAYEAAGYAANRGNATRLKANESVMKRIEELSQRIAERAEWTAADRLVTLKRIADAAENSDPRVAVSAIGEANKMQGSYAPTKTEHTGSLTINELGDDELAAAIAALRPETSPARPGKVGGGTGETTH